MSFPSPDNSKAAMMLPEILALNGKWRAQHPAVIAADEVLTWATFCQRVNQVAQGLVEAGCCGGERVGVVMDNCASTTEVIFGTLRAGAVVVPLNTTVSGDTLDGMLSDAGVRAVFVSGGHRARLSEAGLATALLKVVDDPGGAPGWVSYHEWRDRWSTEPPKVELAPESLCNIIYSSGTTGEPKGIAHSHRARLDWTHDLAHALRYHSGARTLIATGLYSNITWVGMLPTLMLGGTLVIHPKFDVGEVLRELATGGASHLCMVPVQFQRLLEYAGCDKAALSSLQSAMCCGAPLAVGDKEVLLNLLPGAFFELYGTTEGIITTLAPEEAMGRLKSVGRPLPGEDLLVVDSEDQPVPQGEPGEILVLSRFGMTGYWQRPEATREAYWTDRAGREWLRSGDIGRVDAEGFLYITDRKKDMIISGGQNIYPADLESVLHSHPDVVDCAVFGVPSEQWGETPLALVVTRQPGCTSAERLQQWANQRLGKQQRIRFLEFRETLPRNANGKLLKRELRGQVLANQQLPK